MSRWLKNKWIYWVRRDSNLSLWHESNAWATALTPLVNDMCNNLLTKYSEVSISHLLRCECLNDVFTGDQFMSAFLLTLALVIQYRINQFLPALERLQQQNQTLCNCETFNMSKIHSFIFCVFHHHHRHHHHINYNKYHNLYQIQESMVEMGVHIASHLLCHKFKVK